MVSSSASATRTKDCSTKAGKTRGMGSSSPMALSRNRHSPLRSPGLYLFRIPGRALIALTNGDTDTAEICATKAAKFKQAFNEAVGLPERGAFAVAPNRHKKPVDALASNMGHCLWTGVVDQDKATEVAEHLMSPQMYTGWGSVRSPAR